MYQQPTGIADCRNFIVDEASPLMSQGDIRAFYGLQIKRLLVLTRFDRAMHISPVYRSGRFTALRSGLFPFFAVLA
jgi:hypothetical protein